MASLRSKHAGYQAQPVVDPGTRCPVSLCRGLLFFCKYNYALFGRHRWTQQNRVPEKGTVTLIWISDNTCLPGKTGRPGGTAAWHNQGSASNVCPLSMDRIHLRHLFIRFAFPFGTRSGSIKESLGQRTKCLPLGHHSCCFISIARNFVYNSIVNLHKFGSGEGSNPTWGSEDFSYATRSDRAAHFGGPLLGLFERQRQLNLNSTQL